MLKATKNLLQDNILSISIFITIAIAILSLIQPPKSEGLSFLKFENADKVQHCIAYLCLSFSWLMTFKTSKSKKYQLFVILSCIFYGIIIEVLQGGFTSYRTADYKDSIANAVGVFLGLGIFHFFVAKK